MDAYELNDALYRIGTYTEEINMALTPENKVKRDVRRILDEHGAYYFFPATGGYGKSGVPDIIICYKGRFIGVECKAGQNQPTALQLREINAINEHGGQAIVVNEANMNDLRDVLEGIK